MFKLSQNPNITWDIVKSNPQIKWNDCGLSINPNITLDIITKNYYGKFEWEYECIFSKTSFSREVVEKELNDAATKIQRWFLKIIWNPYTKIGKRFHDNNYDRTFKN